MKEKQSILLSLNILIIGSIWNPKSGLVLRPTANKYGLKIKHSSRWPKSACDYRVWQASNT